MKQPPKGPAHPLPRWDPRTPLTAVVVYRGGSECWYQIKVRGRVLHVPGVASIHDVMATIYGEGP